MSKITDTVSELARPIVEAEGCSLWDVEYVREAGTRFLRVYIDKQGGVDIDDCERISRRLDPVLDEADPIPESYVFEVGSAGIERELKRPGDFLAFLGSEVEVKLYQPVNGQKSFVGKYMIEELTRKPVEVEYASEFRYRRPVIYPTDVVIAISQSGETADTLAAVNLARESGENIYTSCYKI